MVSHLNSALFHGIWPALFTSSLQLLFSPGPGLGAPLGSYVEMALYKFNRLIDAVALNFIVVVCFCVMDVLHLKTKHLFKSIDSLGNGNAAKPEAVRHTQNRRNTETVRYRNREESR